MIKKIDSYRIRDLPEAGGMPRKNEMDDLYFRFLHLKKTVEDVTRHRTLDALEQEILTDIAKADLAGKMLNAGGLIHSRIASPVTVRNRPGDLKNSAISASNRCAASIRPRSPYSVTRPYVSSIM
ncbi:MAG: hypothetical protein ACYDB9_04645 [Gammaproteobacteria bacterium]